MAYSERSQAYREKLQNGEYDLRWMEVNSEWGVQSDSWQARVDP